MIVTHALFGLWEKMVPMATTIPIGKGTKDRLRSLGRKGETYDEIIQRLLSLAIQDDFMKRQYERLKDAGSFFPLDDL